MPIIKLDQDKLNAVKGIKITAGGLASRLAAAREKKAEEEATESTKLYANRVALMLDISGSMSSYPDMAGEGGRKTKLQFLQDALIAFAQSINSDDTSVMACTIPWDERYVHYASSDKALLELFASRLATTGNTPLGSTMEKCLSTFSFTRGIIISDGGQTDGELCFAQAETYSEAMLPVDCVHIGRAEDGEETLKRIATITGGLYIKFTDVGNFAKSFKFLSPAFRAMLVSGEDSIRELIGAKELK